MVNHTSSSGRIIEAPDSSLSSSFRFRIDLRAHTAAQYHLFSGASDECTISCAAVLPLEGKWLQLNTLEAMKVTLELTILKACRCGEEARH
jgi:hypothetical protein